MLAVQVKEDCPHVKSENLLPLEKFKSLPFAELKCKNCEEKSELWICLFCGEVFCSRYIKSHFVEHNASNPEHCLCLGIMDLSVWCFECLDTKNNKNAEQNNEKGCYIKSNKTDEYIKIYSDDFKFSGEKEKEKKEEKKDEKKDEKKEEKKLITQDEKYKSEIHINKKGICEHIKNITKEEWEKSEFIKGVKTYSEIKNLYIYDILCFTCNEKFNTYDDINTHYTTKNHEFYIDLNNLQMICMKCKQHSGLILLKDKLTSDQKSSIQFLLEKISFPLHFLTEEEVLELKYQKFVEDFASGKYKNIIFMVGAGISTSAGIPDFRSSTGLFKQLQEKYNLSGPEEFFYKSTFLQKPIYFYEFTKLFDLSQTQPTIAHKFMNFLTKKNMVKYVFTQNIDGLEFKAKIPEDKLIFAHGNFNYGHCAKCYQDIDIKYINEGIQKGEVYYCPKCKGPCKPKIVFYGEQLPERFYKCLDDIKDIDLIIIMGTSLKVMPFAAIPQCANEDAEKVVFNMEKVGYYQYDHISNPSLFIEGKTDQNIIKFLREVKLYDEFEKFIKDEYNQELKDIIDEEKELMNVKDLEEKSKIDKIAEDIDKMKLNDSEDKK